MATTDEHYVCDACSGEFVKGWSDEEAYAEHEEVFGAPPDDPVMVCDDCYQQLIQWGEQTGALDQERARLAAS